MENTEVVKNSTETSANYVLTHEIVKFLKCSYCDLFLSFPPIFMISHEGVKYRCGRCSVKTRFSFRDVMYEKLAKHMKFPCIYKDCTENLTWNNVQDHEKDCKYRTLPCIAADCQEAVLETDFASHFKEKHKKLYHSDKIVLENIHSSGGICVLEKDGNSYVLLYDTDYRDKYRMCLCGIKNIDKQFEITFKTKGNKNSIVMTEHSIVQYNERVHCYKCLKGDCKLEYHAFCHYRKGMLKYSPGRIEKDILKRIFNNDLTCIINVVDEKAENNDDELDGLLMGKDVVIDEVTEDDEAEEEKPAEPVKTEAIKELLECPGCQKQLSDPIFQCLAGHAVCKDCKSKAEDSKCSSCEAKIENTRNYIIEEAITNLKLNKVEPKDAQDKEITCPMSKCHETVKLSAISNHFKESHIENFHFNKVSLKDVYGYYNVNVLMKNGKTYFLFFDFDDSNFGISVCSVETEDELYDVKLLSDNKKYSLNANDQKVIKFNDKEHCFKCSVGYCKINEHARRSKKEIFRRLTTKLNRDCIKNAFRTSTINYQIDIKATKENKTDKVIRQLFECPICKDYMVLPIHQCVAGHTLCNVCKSKVEKCPSCEGNIGETRNFILENISETVELPCSFESKSCTFRGGVKRMASHELECPLNNKKPCVETAANVEETNCNSNGTTSNSKKTTAVPEKTSAAPEKATAVPEKATAVPEKATAVPEKSTAVPEKSTAASPKKSTAASPKKSTAASGKSTVAPEKSTAAPDKPTVAPEKSTAASDKSTAAPKKSTADGMETVDAMETVDGMETVDAMETVDTMETVDSTEAADANSN